MWNKQPFSGRSHLYSFSLSWKQNGPLLAPFMWSQTVNRTRSLHIFSLVFGIIIYVSLNMLWGSSGVKRNNNWLNLMPLIWTPRIIAYACLDLPLASVAGTFSHVAPWCCFVACHFLIFHCTLVGCYMFRSKEYIKFHVQWIISP